MMSALDELITSILDEAKEFPDMDVLFPNLCETTREAATELAELRQAVKEARAIVNAYTSVFKDVQWYEQAAKWLERYGEK